MTLSASWSTFTTKDIAKRHIYAMHTENLRTSGALDYLVELGRKRRKVTKKKKTPDPVARVQAQKENVYIYHTTMGGECQV
jgi:hypothetical protein